MRTIDLNGAWSFKAFRAGGPVTSRQVTRWMPARVPGTVHTDLMAAGKIPDPFFRMNENDVQWVDKVAWIYRKEFDVPEQFLRERKIELVAEGLDTFAEIRCNGRRVGVTANMFIAHRLPLRPFLRVGRNVLEVLFDSPTRRCEELEAKHGRLSVALEPPRVYARKAQYSFSWDWGPKLTTSGIWKEMRIEGYSAARLADPHVRCIRVGMRRALVEVSVDVVRAGTESLTLALFVGGRNHAVERTIPVSGTGARVRVTIPDPELWWPNGYGDQPMYTAVLMLSAHGEEVHELQIPFAIRTVRLVQQNDREGRSFILEVNGVRIFCKGADWIPSDSFIPRIDADTYRTLLTMAVNASMNMIRVWGGGIYEQDIFYTLCDRLGLMVWQDFMFACGEYPSHRAFLAAVRDEAAAAIKRLRNHPCVVLWCGNNECEWLFCTENPTRGPDDMHGAVIFRDLLRRQAAVHDGTRPYWRSSPFGRGFPNSESSGNHHQWIVWSAWQDFPHYETDTARFVTEFGFQAPANRLTMETVTRREDRAPQSAVMEHHNKQVEGPERLVRFQAAHYTLAHGFDEFIYRGQLVQAEALKVAAEHWRRRKFRTAGVLFWQLNDCWPVSSWSVVDSLLQPKAAYFYAKRFFAPVLVSVRRVPNGAEVWLTNDLLERVRGSLTATVREFSGRTIRQRRLAVTVSPNASRRVLILHDLPAGVDAAGSYLHVSFRASDLHAENRFFFAEPKRLRLPATRVRARVSRSRNGVLRLRLVASKFARDVRLEWNGETAPFADNYFDLDPGVAQDVVLCRDMTEAELRKGLSLHWLGRSGRP